MVSIICNMDIFSAFNTHIMVSIFNNSRVVPSERFILNGGVMSLFKTLLSKNTLCMICGGMALLFTMLQAQSSSLDPRLKSQRPAPLEVNKNQISEANRRELDPILTGAAGDVRTREVWEKMKKEQARCNNCALRQPFPGDLSSED